MLEISWETAVPQGGPCQGLLGSFYFKKTHTCNKVINSFVIKYQNN